MPVDADAVVILCRCVDVPEMPVPRSDEEAAWRIDRWPWSR
ncbi:hypothetical protein [Actinocrispum wychmicini]|nr:hypothetical protein [Actinocrispum wychmicini]